MVYEKFRYQESEQATLFAAGSLTASAKISARSQKHVSIPDQRLIDNRIRQGADLLAEHTRCPLQQERCPDEPVR
jgi:hypothetical protein